MDFTPSHQAGPSSFAFQHSLSSSYHGNTNRNEPFEIFDWYPHFQSCHRYFLDHAQHHEPVQVVAAFINIALPFQNLPFPVLSSSFTSLSAHGSHFVHASSSHQPHSPPPPPPSRGTGTGTSSAFVSLTVYLRRLIATGFDTAPILHGFFGDSWPAGIGPLLEIERRNYLFAAKSANWLRVKEEYNIEWQTVPFLRPLQRASESEIGRAEEEWSEWLGMQDWMVGDRGIVIAGHTGGGGGGVGGGVDLGTATAGGIDEQPGMRIKSEPR